MTENRYFQYIAGERCGEVLIYDKVEQDDDLTFVTFKDGSRCNEELIVPLNDTFYEGKLMAEVSDPENLWKIRTEWVGREEERWETNKDGEHVCVQPYVEGRKKIIAMPPRKTVAKFGNIAAAPAKPQTQQEAYKASNSSDPVWIMLEKAKKYDMPVQMELMISLPTKSIYDVIKESFENGGEKIIEYIINNLDDKNLKDSLRKSLYAAYEGTDDATYYSPEVVEEPLIGEPTIQNNTENA